MLFIFPVLITFILSSISTIFLIRKPTDLVVFTNDILSDSLYYLNKLQPVKITRTLTIGFATILEPVRTFNYRTVFKPTLTLPLSTPVESFIKVEKVGLGSGNKVALVVVGTLIGFLFLLGCAIAFKSIVIKGIQSRNSKFQLMSHIKSPVFYSLVEIVIDDNKTASALQTINESLNFSTSTSTSSPSVSTPTTEKEDFFGPSRIIVDESNITSLPQSNSSSTFTPVTAYKDIQLEKFLASRVVVEDKDSSKGEAMVVDEVSVAIEELQMNIDEEDARIGNNGIMEMQVDDEKFLQLQLQLEKQNQLLLLSSSQPIPFNFVNVVTSPESTLVSTTSDLESNITAPVVPQPQVQSPLPTVIVESPIINSTTTSLNATTSTFATINNIDIDATQTSEIVANNQFTSTLLQAARTVVVTAIVAVVDASITVANYQEEQMQVDEIEAPTLPVEMETSPLDSTYPIDHSAMLLVEVESPQSSIILESQSVEIQLGAQVEIQQPQLQSLKSLAEHQQQIEQQQQQVQGQHHSLYPSPVEELTTSFITIDDENLPTTQASLFTSTSQITIEGSASTGANKRITSSWEGTYSKARKAHQISPTPVAVSKSRKESILSRRATKKQVKKSKIRSALSKPQYTVQEPDESELEEDFDFVDSIEIEEIEPVLLVEAIVQMDLPEELPEDLSQLSPRGLRFRKRTLFQQNAAQTKFLREMAEAAALEAEREDEEVVRLPDLVEKPEEKRIYENEEEEGKKFKPSKRRGRVGEVREHIMLNQSSLASLREVKVHVFYTV